MKVTLRQIKESETILQKVLTFPLNVKIAFKMRKLSNSLQVELKTIEECRIDLVKKYGESIKETGNIQVPAANIVTYMNEFNEFLDTETEFQAEKFLLDDFEGLKFSINDINNLEYLLIETEDEKPIKKEAESLETEE